MIRRYAFWLRALLMLVDGLLAVGLLVVLSILRFGPDWAVWWRQIVPVPQAFLALYAVGWVAVLALNGLYRPRARWRIRSEAADLARATVVMALLSLSVLFLFKVPDVSRLFLLFLFPAQFAGADHAGRHAPGFRWLRGRGHNLRFVLVLGAGPRGQAFAAKLAEHPELGLRIVGFLDDQEFDLAGRLDVLGRLEDLEAVLHTRVVDEVAICLPFSQWNLIDTITRICEEEGKIVRIPMDVLDRAIPVGKVEDLDGTPVFSLVSGPGPDRSRWPSSASWTSPAPRLGLVLLRPLFLAVVAVDPARGRRPILFRQERVGLHGRPFEVRQVPLHGARRRGRAARACWRINELNGPAFKMTADPRITRTGRWLRRYVHRRAAPALERAARRDEPGGPAAAAARRGGRATTSGTAGGCR